jgi:hypothetical protein
VGSSIAPFMHHQRPDKTAAMVLCGTGYNPTKEFTKKRIDNYSAEGIGYRWRYTFRRYERGISRDTDGAFFANMFSERNEHADAETIIHQFRALAAPYPEGHHERIACPMIILTGSEDGSHAGSFALQARVPNCELKVLPGAGHACQIEQPWLFNRFMIEFLDRHGLFPGAAKPAKVDRLNIARDLKLLGAGAATVLARSPVRGIVLSCRRRPASRFAFSSIRTRLDSGMRRNDEVRIDFELTVQNLP